MAQKQVIVDDLDGAPDAATVPFSVEGYAYEVDLTEDHKKALYEALEQYMAAGRRAGQAPAGKASAGLTKRQRERASKQRLDKVRDWARANGFPDVSPHGKIPDEVMAAYRAAGPHAA
jgi:hypothetical protein